MTKREETVQQSNQKHRQSFKSKGTLVSIRRACAALGALAIALCPLKLGAQPNTRLLLQSGWGVPGHAGFAFGAFSDLAMNEAGEIAFLSVLSSPRTDLRAVVRSTGVGFSVVAFQGLLSPVPKTTYESFSAPSLNRSGVLAFTATLKDMGDEHLVSAIIRVEGARAQAVAVAGPASAASGGPVPATTPLDRSDATFVEFSAPLVNAAGNVLFAARTGGPNPSSGLFLWTPQGIRAVALPDGFPLKANDLLIPFFSGHDAAVFVSRKTPTEAATDQFFRALAIKNLEELKPPPAPTETTEVLPARPNAALAKMILVLTEGSGAQTELLEGDPKRPVVAKQPSAAAAIKPPATLGKIQAQTPGARGNIIFASAPATQPSDLALFCLCDAQVVRLTSEFSAIAQAPQGAPNAAGRIITSLVGDGQHTAAFIASGGLATEANAIYVTSVP